MRASALPSNERVDAKTFLAELKRKPSAKGSHSTWGGWELRVCCYCGGRVTLEDGDSGHNFNYATGEATSWHAACGSGPPDLREAA